MEDIATKEWLESLSDEDLRGVTYLEVMNMDNKIPERTKALLFVLAGRLKGENTWLEKI